MDGAARWPYSRISMKYFIVGFLFAAALAMSLPCQAGAGPEEKQTLKASSAPVTPSAKPTHHKHIMQVRSDVDGYCRNSYCARAKNSPWFPAAPGD
jgi:hypothetical protein